MKKEWNCFSLGLFLFSQGCQTPQEEEEPEPILNEDGVKLRVRKPKSATDGKLEEVMSRMNISDSSAVPRFDYIEEDSVKVSYFLCFCFSPFCIYRHMQQLGSQM